MKKRADLKVALDMSNGEPSDIHELENELRSGFCRQHRSWTRPFADLGEERGIRTASTTTPTKNAAGMLELENGNVLSGPPRQSTARRKLRWSSLVHLSLGTADLLYRLVATPLLPPPAPLISLSVRPAGSLR